jgi:hypothetical protein
MVHQLTFQLEAGDTGWPIATPRIDGVSLAELVNGFEVSRGYNDPAGGYGGIELWAKIVEEDELYLSLWDDDSSSPGETTMVALSCECGVDGCWPLLARVRLVGQQVTWDGFAQPHRPARDYGSFGPFTFDVDQYRSAMDQIRREGGEALRQFEAT